MSNATADHQDAAASWRYGIQDDQAIGVPPDDELRHALPWALGHVTISGQTYRLVYEGRERARELRAQARDGLVELHEADEVPARIHHHELHESRRRGQR